MRVNSKLSQLMQKIAMYLSILHIICSFLAHGDSFRSLANRFRLGTSTVHNIVKETCAAIWDSLVEKEMSPLHKKDGKKLKRNLTAVGIFLIALARSMASTL